MKGRRSFEDEQLVKHYFQGSNHLINCVIDLRTKASALSSQLTQSEGEFYGNCKVYHSNILSSSEIQELLNGFKTALRVKDISTSAYLQAASLYKRQIQSFLRPAIFAARVVGIEGASVLLHCEDGRDITIIVSCLAKLLLDPFYRTLHGFSILMQEECIDMGFTFTQPLLTILLDCIHQIQCQFVDEFEFTGEWLMDGVENVWQQAPPLSAKNPKFNPKKEIIIATAASPFIEHWVELYEADSHENKLK